MSRPDLLARIADAQAQRARAGLLRRLRTVDSVEGPHIVVAGKSLIDFASNDYLGLAQHPALREALTRTAKKWGVGAGAAHLLGGHRDEHAALEEKLARWTGRERALLFSTGYMANLGVGGALLGNGDVCVQDKLNHASLIDATRLSGAELVRYRHADVDSAGRQLRARPHAAAMLTTDAVFSMDGDLAPLVDLSTLCKTHNATLMVDDAHGIGVLGADGAGSLSDADLSQNDAPVLMSTLGKALGVTGAFVAGSTALIDGLIQFARPYVYTTAIPPAFAAAASAAVDIARDDNERRARLHQHIARFRDGAAARGIALLPSRTPIQPVPIGDSATASAIAQQLEVAGFHVPAIRPPSVPANGARLRVSLSAAHAQSDIERLLDAFVVVLGPKRH
ncbi:MAG: 8-amino-7-oxononanoate synthase [Xanthomonadales bacterium PRO7]|nr:8-amino-7-oxononanoate synthase [Xanthomonadales bacterium PRO7]